VFLALLVQRCGQLLVSVLMDDALVEAAASVLESICMINFLDFSDTNKPTPGGRTCESIGVVVRLCGFPTSILIF